MFTNEDICDYIDLQMDIEDRFTEIVKLLGLSFCVCQVAVGSVLSMLTEYVTPPEEYGSYECKDLWLPTKYLFMDDDAILKDYQENYYDF